MTYNMKKRNYILLLCILLCAAPLMAQDASKIPNFPAGMWVCKVAYPSV